MSIGDPLLDRASIEDAVWRLGDRLARRGVVADLYVFGGAAMALAYDARRSTRDIDAVFQPHGIVLDEARAVAGELGLPRWWLNEQASSYVARGGDPNAPRVFDHPGLRVSAASPEHLLAMKVLAARRRDAEDLQFLVKHLQLADVGQVLTLCAGSSRTRKFHRGPGWCWRTCSGKTQGAAKRALNKALRDRGRVVASDEDLTSERAVSEVISVLRLAVG